MLWVLGIVKCFSFCNQVVCEILQGNIGVTSKKLWCHWIDEHVHDGKALGCQHAKASNYCLKALPRFHVFFQAHKNSQYGCSYVGSLIQGFEFNGRLCWPFFYNQNCYYIWWKVSPSYLEDFLL